MLWYDEPISLLSYSFSLRRIMVVRPDTPLSADDWPSWFICALSHSFLFVCLFFLRVICKTNFGWATQVRMVFFSLRTKCLAVVCVWVSFFVSFFPHRFGLPFPSSGQNDWVWQSHFWFISVINVSVTCLSLEIGSWWQPRRQRWRRFHFQMYANVKQRQSEKERRTWKWVSY